MSMGFNSNVEVGDAVYHVQTEDRGLQHPFVDTVVLSGGRVVLPAQRGLPGFAQPAAPWTKPSWAPASTSSIARSSKACAPVRSRSRNVTRYGRGY